MKKYFQIGLAMMTALMVSGCQQEKMKLKNQEYTIEYGDTISNDVSTYLNNTKEYMKEVQISGIPANEDGKEYPAVGNYELELSNKNDSVKVSVAVKDTVAPIFTDKTESVTVENGKKLDTKLFTAKDLSKVQMTIDDSKVDYSKAGEYKVIVKATDKSNNTTQKEVQLTVKKKETTDTKKETTTSTTSSQSSSNKTSTNSSQSTSNKQNQTSSNNSNSSSSSDNKNESTSNNSGSTGSTGSGTNSQDLWVSNLKVAKSYSKIMIASAPSSSSRQGTFTYYQKVDGKWKEVLETTAYFGSNGVGAGKEGGRKSPVGQYTFTKLMGLSSNPGTQLPYHRIDNNDYWCGETLYNQFVDEDVTQHNCSKKNDEHLADYTLPYRYVAAFSYNPGNVKGKGFAYFLHSKGNTNYTGGCVAISNTQMKKVMQAIDGNTVFIIDLHKNITKY